RYRRPAGPLRPGRGGRKAQLAYLVPVSSDAAQLSDHRMPGQRYPGGGGLRSSDCAGMQQTNLVTSETLTPDQRHPDDRRLPHDPRDPRGLRSDAPLLAGWLSFTAQAAAGKVTPMSVPGHKQRQDLTGAVVAGDVPLYGGVDSIKHADVPLSDAEARAAALWG